MEAIRRSWKRLGKKRYEQPTRLPITADSDGRMTVHASPGRVTHRRSFSLGDNLSMSSFSAYFSTDRDFARGRRTCVSRLWVYTALGPEPSPPACSVIWKV